MTDRFEIGFLIDHDINQRIEIMALTEADILSTEAAEIGEKGVILCQVHVYEHDRAAIIGRFINNECALEVAAVMEKHGYKTAVDRG